MRQETHWKMMADRQQQQNLERMKEEHIYKEKIKKAYMSELSQQLQMNEDKKRKDKEQAANAEKQLISHNINHYRQEIEKEDYKNHLIYEKEAYMSSEGHRLEVAKREQLDNITRIGKSIEKENHEIARAAEREREEQEASRKRELNRQLLQEVETNRLKKKKERQRQVRYEKATLDEGQNRKLSKEIANIQFYHNLRERSKVVDYGSHNYLEQKHHKSLIDRKQEEWNQSKQTIQLSERRRQQQEQYRDKAVGLENQYRLDLQRQMKNDEAGKRDKRLAQLSDERSSLQQAEYISNALLQQKAQQEQGMKREMANILKMQAGQNQDMRQYDRSMNRVEEGMNRNFLNDRNRQRTSIDTFQIDHLRKKQYSTIEKSLNIRNQEPPEPNYFARRGVSVLQ